MRTPARPLEAGYSARIARLSEVQWREIDERFDDTSVYQTWAYAVASHGERSLTHCVVSKSGQVVAAAQARLVRFPLVRGGGAAYVRWGPLWRRPNEPLEPLDFRMALRALRNEFVLNRGLFLRMYPLLFDSDGSEYRAILSEEGFSAAYQEVPQRTLLLSLDPSLEDIRKNFDHKWRNRLSRAERNDLKCVEGTEDALFSAFAELYRDLLRRKRFDANDLSAFQDMQGRLPVDRKLRVFLNGQNDSFSCGAICAAIGGMGIYLFGASNEAGMSTNGSYLNQWNAIQWLKQQGCRSYNLNGINPDTNPGTYHFKAGIAGKTHSDVRYLGRFDSYAGSVTACSIHLINRAIVDAKRLVAERRRPSPTSATVGRAALAQGLWRGTL